MPKARKTKVKPKTGYKPYDDSVLDEHGSRRDVPIKSFQMEFKNGVQRLAWNIYQQHDVLFLLGAAGSGKTHLAMAFAIEEILNRQSNKKKIILTRPVVEAGESLGFLPGGLEEKINPYMMPLWDCMTKITGATSDANKMREIINKSYEIAPIAYLRGRAQPLDSKLYTPKGCIEMGDVKVGDQVFGSDGKPTNVIGVYPQGKKKVYSVEFSDGAKVECCAEHLWSTQSHYEKRYDKGFSVKSTEDIMRKVKSAHNQKIHRIPMISGPVEFEGKKTNIDPYLMGLLLGDGCLHESASITFTTADDELIQAVSDLIPDSLTVKYADRYSYRIVKKDESYTESRNELKSYIRDYGLLGSKSYEKFVPDAFKYNTAKHRLAVLQGLMDTDGCATSHGNGKCRVQFSSTSEKLANDVVFLVQSLGGIAHIRKREYEENDSHVYKDHIISHTRDSYCVEAVLKGFNCFRLSRKANRCEDAVTPVRLISSITEIGEKECQCIQVDAPDHLYLTDGFVVTHNTFDDSVCILDEAQNCTASQLKLFLTRMGNNSKMIITGDPMQSDLGGGVTDLAEVVERLESVVGVGVVWFDNECIVRHKMVGEILKRLEN
jgi:phosphate starvation-inducible PhoH-like protein